MGQPIKAIARVTALSPALSTSREATKGREAQVISLLGEHGALHSIDLAKILGYSGSSGINALVTNMIKAGKITRTGTAYHLKGQSPKVLYFAPHQVTGFFDGEGKQVKLRRWLLAHQDEPTTLTAIGRAVGYGSSNAVNYVITDMLDKKVIRRYQNPEDYGFEWRYQYIDDKLSGVVTTVPARTPEPVATKKQHRYSAGNFHHFDEDDCPTVEVALAPKKYRCKECSFESDQRMGVPQHARWAHKKTKAAPTNEKVVATDDEPEAPLPEPTPEPAPVPVATPAAEPPVGMTVTMVEEYAKESFWVTGSKDTREFVVWLKERALAGAK